jgi:Txe/YoeB family toxin of Txe-Axe toxin-antitoxin module
MNVFRHDREVLQEPAEKIANIAALPIHNAKIKMWKKVNSLKSKKPMVWINNIPWHEMGVEDELKLNATNEFCRKIEMEIRRTIYRWENMRVDMVVEPKIVRPLVINNSGFGIEVEDADITTVDSDVHSRHFHIQIKEEDDIQKIKMPKISYDEDATEQNYQIMSEIFDEILEVEKCGTPDFWFAP